MQEVEFTYTNYRGETARRRVVPVRIYFGRTVYHPDPQWLLEAFDVEKQANRDFAMVDIRDWASNFSVALVYGDS